LFILPQFISISSTISFNAGDNFFLLNTSSGAFILTTGLLMLSFFVGSFGGVFVGATLIIFHFWGDCVFHHTNTNVFISDITLSSLLIIFGDNFSAHQLCINFCNTVCSCLLNALYNILAAFVFILVLPNAHQAKAHIIVDFQSQPC
jgi:hypothetical protein